MRRAVIVALSVAAIAVLMVGALWVFQRRFVYFPSGSVGSPPPGAESVSFTTDDGLELAGWYYPSRSTGGATAVVFPGNGGNRSDRRPLADRLVAMGYGVLLVDYRGYGGNPGSPAEDGLVMDGLAAVEFLTLRHGVDPDRLIYFGESLGTGVAVAVAGVREPALVILRSPYPSLPDVAAETLLVGQIAGLMWDEFPTIERIGQIEAPVLVIAGTMDRTIPVALSRKVFGAASEPKLLHEVAADHNDGTLAWGFLEDPAVVAFIEASVAESEA